MSNWKGMLTETLGNMKRFSVSVFAMGREWADDSLDSLDKGILQVKMWSPPKSKDSYVMVYDEEGTVYYDNYLNHSNVESILLRFKNPGKFKYFVCGTCNDSEGLSMDYRLPWCLDYLRCSELLGRKCGDFSDRRIEDSEGNVVLAAKEISKGQHAETLLKANREYMGCRYTLELEKDLVSYIRNACSDLNTWIVELGRHYTWKIVLVPVIRENILLLGVDAWNGLPWNKIESRLKIKVEKYANANFKYISGVKVLPVKGGFANKLGKGQDLLITDKSVLLAKGTDGCTYMVEEVLI
jgi:hypothetical protein